MLLDAFGVAIGDEVQPDVVLKKCLSAGKHQRESLSRVGHLTHELVAVAGEACFPKETLKYPLFSSSYRGCCTLRSDRIEEMAGETEIVFDDGLL